jgi:hypothetical protein
MRVLHTAGCWLKDQDPQTADIFYKALVRRCRRTELGRVADLNRWFPELDDDGKPIERVRRPKPVEPPPEEPAEALPLPEETQQTDSQ